LTFNAEGLKRHTIFSQEQRPWSAVTSIEEGQDSNMNGGLVWGIWLEFQQQSDLKRRMFVRDIYTIRHKKLLLVMREFHARATSV